MLEKIIACFIYNANVNANILASNLRFLKQLRKLIPSNEDDNLM